MEELFRSFRHRASWTNARKILKANGISTGHGWDTTLEKIKESGFQPNKGKLEDALIEHILCGEKFTKLYPIGGSVKPVLQSVIKGMKIASSPAADCYPYLMDDTSLAAANGDFTPVRVEVSDDGIGLVFSSVFHIKRRIDITFDEIGMPQEWRTRYDEVVGIVREPVQMFHVVWVPHNRDYIEIRVDSPKGVAEADLHGMHYVLKSIVNGWQLVGLGDPVNLFPAVRPFYEDATDGTVTQMTFQTTTGGIKDEKMPRRRRDSDQRSEPYHVAGKRAVDAISIYRISVEWDFPVDEVVYNPSISLAAGSPAGNGPSGTPKITGALIANCVRAADYEFAIERLGKKANLDL